MSDVTPFLSIIIPVFNRERLVKDCISSVLAQQDEDWELIVVDDGSTDNTWDVLLTFAAQDNRIRVFQRNGGPKGANRCRNQGIDNATGSYLFFLDSDDLLAPEFVTNRKRYVQEYPAFDFLVFQEVNFSSDPNDWFYNQMLFRSENDDDLLRFLQRDSPWLTSGPVIKREICSKQIRFREELTCGQDWDFFVRLLMTVNSYKKIQPFEKPDFFHRMDSSFESISQSKRFDIWFSNKAIGLGLILQSFSIYMRHRKVEAHRFALLCYYFWFCKTMSDLDKQKEARRMWRIFFHQKYISFWEWKLWDLYLSRLFYGRGRMKTYYIAFIRWVNKDWNYSELSDNLQNLEKHP